jgi:hypothetical protein
MSQPPIARLLVAIGLLVAGGSAVDAYLNLNDTFLGEICDPTEVDVLEFDALAGSGIVIRVLSTGMETLHPRIVLTDQTTGNVLGDESGLFRAIIEGVTLPTTGRYEIRVLSADGTVGTYGVVTTGRNAPDKVKFVVNETVAGGGIVEVTFDALAGFTFEGAIAAASPGPRFANPTLEGPHGPISLTGVLFQLPDLIRIDTLPLGITTLGSFTLRADNVGATGDVRTNVRLRSTLPRKTIVEEDDCL